MIFMKELKELEELKPIVSTMKTSTKVWANERSEVITTLTTNEVITTLTTNKKDLNNKEI
jgi:hypothetical protein